MTELRTKDWAYWPSAIKILCDFLIVSSEQMQQSWMIKELSYKPTIPYVDYKVLRLRPTTYRRASTEI